MALATASGLALSPLPQRGFFCPPRKKVPCRTSQSGSNEQKSDSTVLWTTPISSREEKEEDEEEDEEEEEEEEEVEEKEEGKGEGEAEEAEEEEEEDR